MNNEVIKKAHFHLPGLFEFYDFYKEFLPVFYGHKEYFYDYVDIGSIYGAPSSCIWGGGRMEADDTSAYEVIALLNEYNISGRLTFSNSLLRQEHLNDSKCNKLCEMFAHKVSVPCGVIVHSDLLLDYLINKYPEVYFISSTTKVITDFNELKNELNRKEFKFVVPDFRLNKQFESLTTLSQTEKDKVEFLCNECCYIGCLERRACYENVSSRILGETTKEHICKSPESAGGYKFSKAMENQAFISSNDIKEIYMPHGFSNFKIEGRSLGSAIILEFLLHYLAKPEYHLKLREMLYLDSMLDLF